MSKLQFQIGDRQFVQISLPSREPGDGSIYIGKAKAQINSLRCSTEISVREKSLKSFGRKARRVYENLKGEFHLESECTKFELIGTIDNKGRIRIEVFFKDYRFDEPENVEWEARGNFTCYPEHLKNAIREVENVQD